MMRSVLTFIFIGSVLPVGAEQDDEAYFQDVVLPMMDQVCFDCHEPGLSKGGVPFLEAVEAGHIRDMRAVWRSVASQLHNRTMPPLEEAQPDEKEREEVAAWIRSYLKRTAPLEGPYAGQVMARRLNRLEYDNTIRDLVGVDLNFDETLPADGGTGEGFNNSGEALFLQPMLLERYLDAAQQIVDAAIVSPRHEQRVSEENMHPGGGNSPEVLKHRQSATALVTCYLEDDYSIVVRLAKPSETVRIQLSIDGIPTQELRFRPSDGKGKTGAVEEKIEARLTRGVHAIRIRNLSDDTIAQVREVRLLQHNRDLSEKQTETHVALLGLAPGKTPEKPREQAKDQVTSFLKLAFRRPVKSGEVEKYLRLYDRGEERGDPWEESMKLAIRGILVSPDFLYRLEQPPKGGEIQPITDHELATRLSYFLWATMPDAELTSLADQGKLRDSKVLRGQVNRLLDDPRALGFARDFTGQWLGTKDVGGRVAPITNAIQETYTPEIAADMREEVVRIFHHLLEKDRSVLELVSSDYSFLTGRLAKFYELEESKGLPKDEFRKVTLKNQQRGGVLGAGAVLAMTSHYKQTSPVLRGAWVFDTLIGDPVPPPPPNVPELPGDKKGERKLTDREKLALHRESSECKSCHNIIDPIGFALQNYDYIGRWRSKDQGQPIDTKGALPSGESFGGPRELKEVLITSRREDYLRNLVRKLLSYGLGRSLVDRDDATIETLVQQLEANDHGARELIHGIVQSVPFQNTQAAP